MGRDAFPIRARAWLAEFVSGATTPCLPALLATLTVTGLCFLMCAMLITPDLLATDANRYFVAHADDEYGHLTGKAWRIARSRQLGLSVLLVGASDLRDAISDGGELEQLLEQRVGQPVRVHRMTAGGLTPWEAACIADSVPPPLQGAVILEVRPRILGFSAGRLRDLARFPRLGLPSRAFDEELRLSGLDEPWRVGNYFLDHYRFFVSRQDALMRNLVKGPVQLSRWQRDGDVRKHVSDRELMVDAMRSVAMDLGYLTHRKENLAVYARVVRRLRKTGRVQVALLEGVVNPRATEIIMGLHDGRRVHEAYRSDIQRFSLENGLPYWDLTEDAGLTGEDFADYTHMQDPNARCRFTRALADRLAHLLSQHELVRGAN